jgi:hypothetical protein
MRVSAFIFALIPFAMSVRSIAATEQDYHRAGIEGIAIKPSDTDPSIHEFDSPHYIYVDRSVVVTHKSPSQDRHELFLYLTGTGGSGRTAIRFCQYAARDGYRVVNIMYPDDVPAAVCRNDSDPKAFETFRMAIIEGGTTEKVSVSRADSIEDGLKGTCVDS